VHVSVKRFNLCVAQPSPFFIVVHTFTNLQTFISSACNTEIWFTLICLIVLRCLV